MRFIVLMSCWICACAGAQPFIIGSDPVMAGNAASSGITNVTGGLVAWWAMDENSGTQILDGSGNGHTGNFSGSVAWTNGISGSALRFGGAGYVDCGQVGSNNFPAISVSFWVFPFDYSGSQYICGKLGGSGNRGWQIPAASSGGLGSFSFLYFDSLSGNQDSFVQINIVSNQWTHVVFVFQASTSKTSYTNGVLGLTSSSGVLTNVCGLSTLPFQIASRGDASGNYKGVIDDLRIYNRALNSNEVWQLYQYK